MKKLICLSLVLVILCSLCACAKTVVEEEQEVTLHFVFDEAETHARLAEDEAAHVIEILNGKRYDIVVDTPICGFDKNISLQVGERTYAIARDTCTYILDCGNMRYFVVSVEDMDYIHALFEQYGGSFPCV
ncbi:MAG: hypothetical protein IKT58_06570 [Oscillospiraceae bacterium]|nr:hypothetical protein [Oscillospiraceae bacterium]